MTGEQDTGNPERLPLAERARRGLLAGESELWLGEIMQLEFPAFTSYEDRQRPDYSGWGKSVEAAIQYGLLGDSPRRVETVKSETHRFLDTRRAYLSGPRERTIHVVGCSDRRVPREPYRTCRATQPNAPTGSLIHLWLSPPPKSEPDKPEQGAAPALSDKEIKALRENGLSVDVIHEQYGIPRDRIKRVNRRYDISPLPRGPKPKTSD